jgi:predicted aldo/keto reductase-like oxidoreductase
MAKMTRREFIKLMGGLIAGAAISPLGGLPLFAAGETIPQKTLGKTGARVSIIGLGGFNISLQDFTDASAADFVKFAVDNGINFMDNARAYNDGLAERRMGLGLKGGYREKVFLMTKICDHSRSAKESIKSLEESLRALQTDFIDLFMFHEINYASDIGAVRSSGVLDALLKAREQGKIRFIGFTGHKSPKLHLEMINCGFDWDAVMLPLGIMDYHKDSFTRTVLPVLLKKNIGAIGFKSMGGFMSGVPEKTGISYKDCLRYSLSQHAATVVVGMNNMTHLRENIATCRSFIPMAEDERNALISKSSKFADDPGMERYKNTTDYDNAAGKKLHGIK